MRTLLFSALILCLAIGLVRSGSKYRTDPKDCSYRCVDNGLACAKYESHCKYYEAADIVCKDNCDCPPNYACPIQSNGDTYETANPDS